MEALRAKIRAMEANRTGGASAAAQPAASPAQPAAGANGQATAAAANAAPPQEEFKPVYLGGRNEGAGATTSQLSHDELRKEIERNRNDSFGGAADSEKKDISLDEKAKMLEKKLYNPMDNLPAKKPASLQDEIRMEKEKGGSGGSGERRRSRSRGRGSSRDEPKDDLAAFTDHMMAEATGGAAPSTGSKPRRGGHKVFVGNLPPKVTKKQLQYVFTNYGNVLDIIVMNGRALTGHSCALVEFETLQECNTAIHTLDKKYEIKRGEGPMVVKHSEGGAGANDKYMNTLGRD